MKRARDKNPKGVKYEGIDADDGRSDWSSRSAGQPVDDHRGYAGAGMRARPRHVLDVCVSYVPGVADALQLERRTCRPNSDAATLQTITIVRRYISDHPENWRWHPSMLVPAPLLKAFPCPRSAR